MAGVQQLGYLAFEVSDLARWRAFCSGVLGLECVEETADSLAFRMDSYARRFFFRAGPADDLVALGWEVGNSEDLETLAARLRSNGSAVEQGTDADCAQRHVQELLRFQDPAGVPNELFVGPERNPEPFESPRIRSGFVAEDFGLGHLVIRAEDKDESFRFYTEVLGFRLSDRIIADLKIMEIDIAFLHVNGRHHSVALAEHQDKNINHFMLEVRDPDDVGRALNRTLRQGLAIHQTLGKHPNDKMFSFYAKTPSGFNFEVGYGGVVIDDATWEPQVYDRVSLWGHLPPEILSGPPTKGGQS
jgi:2,3-dihydroxybiphenyl 1,2-dioxygenase